MLRSPCIAFLVAFPTTFAGATELSAKDARGKTVTVTSRPIRIVSLAPAVTEILFAVGAGSRIAGVTSYCDFPAEAKRLPKIGDFRASVEKVVARRPDLVIASASANAQVIPQIERLGIPLFAVDTKTVAQVLDSIEGVGRITDSRRGAANLLKAMRNRIEGVKKRVSRLRARPRTLVIVDLNGPWVAGRDNYMDDLITLAGGSNIARSAGIGWQRWSAERALIGKPEVIIVTDRNASRIASLPGWSKLPAVKSGRVYGNVPIAFVRPGPRLPEALGYVFGLLHPLKSPASR